MKKALITGITGQDGSYLADFLLDKGYEVHGVRRRSSAYNLGNIQHLNTDPQINGSRFFLHYGDLTDSSNLTHILTNIKPDEIYNLAAQSHVHISFDVPEYTTDVNALGTLKLLEAIKNTKYNSKIYQASSSELYGKTLETPQNENTPFNPRSPYAVSKLFSYWTIKNYREAYNMFACNGILFNHESPRRGTPFVSRKISEAVANISRGKWKKMYLGNLNAKRDWGYAKEYIEAMWLILQHDKPDDFVIASGENHTVREFVEKAFLVVGKKIIWEGSLLDEVGIDEKTGNVLVGIDPYYYRPLEVDNLLGDPSKARKILGWKPNVSFDDLVRIMVEADLEDIK